MILFLKKYIKRIVILVLLLLIGVICMACYIYNILSNRNTDYFSEVGLKAWMDEVDIIKKYGEPESITINELGMREMCYEDILVRFFDDPSERGIANVCIIGNKYKLKKEKIGVGSTIDEVKEVFTDDMLSYEGNNQYYDNKYFIRFEYDENNIVKSILIFTH